MVLLSNRPAPTAWRCIHVDVIVIGGSNALPSSCSLRSSRGAEYFKAGNRPAQSSLRPSCLCEIVPPEIRFRAMVSPRPLSRLPRISLRPLDPGHTESIVSQSGIQDFRHGLVAGITASTSVVLLPFRSLSLRLLLVVLSRFLKSFRRMPT